MAGFDASRPAFFSWLGVVPYLRRESVTATLAFIASLPRLTAVIFDYGIPASRLGWIERLVFARLARRVAAIGEPFRSFYEPEALRAELLGLGFRAIEDLDAQAISATSRGALTASAWARWGTS